MIGKLTYEKFINLLEECWGPYGSDVYKKLMLNWISETYREEALPYLFNRIFEECSRQFKNCPGAKEIRDIVKQIKKEAEDISGIPEIEKPVQKKLLTEEMPAGEQRDKVGDLAGKLAEDLRVGKVREKRERL